MRRIRERVPRGKLLMIAEAIFNSKIRYGIALYLNPTFETEEVKTRHLSNEARKLQIIQNNMIRMIFSYKPLDKVNMEELRGKIGMFSVNQMNCYHVLIEAFNVIHFGSAEKIQEKWKPMNERIYSDRRKLDVRVPIFHHVRCKGFSWYGAKMWNNLPEDIKSIENPGTFKIRIKQHIWDTIPSF